MWETWVRSLGWEDPLEKRKATHSSILAWRIPWTISPWGCKESDTTEWVSLHFTSLHLMRQVLFFLENKSNWLKVTWSVQFSSVAQSCLTLCDPMNRSTPGLPVHHQLPEFSQTHVHRVSDAIQPSHPLSSPPPPAPNPSQHQSLFQWVNSSHEVAKYWSFSFSITPSKEIAGLISFRMDWLGLLAVQGTLKSPSAKVHI